MWGLVLMFAVASALEPTRMGIAALVVALPRPIRNLFAYWVGIFAAGIGFYLAGLFVLRDYIAPVVVVMQSATTSPVVPPIKIAVGLLAISLVAAVVVRSRARQAVPVPVPIGGPSGMELRPEKPTGFAALSLPRISWSSRIEGGSAVMAFIAGLATSTPPLEFFGAMLAILASGAAATVQLSAVVAFMLVASAIVEIPLVFYLISPAKTQAVLMQLQGWLRAHNKPILLVFFGLFGIFMVAGGVGGI
jgi:Sap, sulfolipid-1-addressing protein